MILADRILEREQMEAGGEGIEERKSELSLIAHKNESVAASEVRLNVKVLRGPQDHWIPRHTALDLSAEFEGFFH